ncbi:MAG TPA: APC family permease [Candidatus Nanopelagicaceae bacterium]
MGESNAGIQSSEGQLRQNAIGSVSIVFFVLAAAAPLAAIIGVAPIIFGGAGSTGAPGAYLLCTLILLVFSVGFAAMSRHVSGPGGFAVYIARAFGIRAGNGASFVALLGYNAFAIGNLGLFGYLAKSIFNDKFGLHLAWWVYCLIAIAVIGFLGYREVNLSAKVLGVFLLLEMLIILVLDGATIAKGGNAGINVSGFSPSAMFSGAPGIVFLLAFACFVGFEATTLYGEEARDRHRTIPRATYIAVILVGIFYTLVMWVFQLGYGNSEAARIAKVDPGNFIFTLNTRYVGRWSTDVMEWLVITSIFACVLSFHNALTRYMFALGRDGLFPKALARTHKTQDSPHIASLVQTAITLVVIAVFALAKADPYAKLYSWFVGIGAVAILLLYTVASVAASRFLRRDTQEKRLWVTTIAPILAALAMAIFVYLAIHNFSALTGSTSRLVNLLWILGPIMAIIGYVVTPSKTNTALNDVGILPQQ